MNKEVKNANWIFLSTVLLSLFAGYIIITMFLGVKGIFDVLGLDGQSVMKAYEAFKNNACLTIIVSQIILILPAVLYIVNSKEKISLRFNKIEIPTVILLVIFSYLIMPLMTFINLVSMLFVKNEIADTVNDMLTETSLPILIIIVGLLPGICEELVYRGVLYNSHRKAGLAKAILMSGLMFGVIHMNLNQFAYAFIMGVIFAIVVEVTDSIISTMLIHFVINTSSIVTNYVYNNVEFFKQFSQGTEDATEILKSDITTTMATVMIYGVMAVVSTALAALVLYAIACIRNKKSVFKEIIDFDKKKAIFSLPLIIGLAISFIYMILLEVM